MIKILCKNTTHRLHTFEVAFTENQPVTMQHNGTIAQLVSAEDSYFSNVPYTWKLCKGWCQIR